jgi:hypothetical protein
VSVVDRCVSTLYDDLVIKIKIEYEIECEILVTLQSHQKNSIDITITHYIFNKLTHWSWRKHFQINQ